MNIMMNALSIVLLIALIFVLKYAYGFFKESGLEDEKTEQTEEKKPKKSEKKESVLSKLMGDEDAKNDTTVLVNMPVFSYKLPDEEWKSITLKKAKTSIGRSEDCDIVIPDMTCGMKQSEIVMKIHKINPKSKGTRYFVLKNLYKENPVSFLNGKLEDNDWRDIAGTIPMAPTENIFYLGLVECRLTFNPGKRRVSAPPVLDGMEESEVTKPQKEDAKPDDHADSEEAMEAEMAEELIKEQRRIVRRSPRSGPRI